MILLINTACEPHFVSLWHDDIELDAEIWTEGRADGEKIQQFLKNHKSDWENIEKVAGISGPGGFSSLRVASVVINALQMVMGADLIEVSAHEWGKYFIKEENIEIIMNTFGQKGLIQHEKDVVEVNLADLKLGDDKNGVFVGFLPPEKQDLIPKSIQQIEISHQKQRKVLYEVAKTKKGQKRWQPDYYFPSV